MDVREGAPSKPLFWSSHPRPQRTPPTHALPRTHDVFCLRNPHGPSSAAGRARKGHVEAQGEMSGSSPYPHYHVLRPSVRNRCLIDGPLRPISFEEPDVRTDGRTNERRRAAVRSAQIAVIKIRRPRVLLGPRVATASRSAPKRIYKPRRGLIDISALSNSRVGRSVALG
jgi:hypothetical protein